MDRDSLDQVLSGTVFELDAAQMSLLPYLFSIYGHGHREIWAF